MPADSPRISPQGGQSVRSWQADPILWLGLGLVGLLLTALSIARYVGYNAGMFDLGNMTQSIWSATQGEPLLYSRYEGVRASRLAGHVELIYLLLALPYALWPDPRVLLGIQAALFALGALPVYWMARRRDGGEYAGRCLALIYLFYPAAQTAVLFDIHGDTFAMPLLLFALDALDRRAWRSYALFVALSLSCKFYVAAPVAALGAYALLWGEQRRVGAWTIAAAVLYGSVAFLALRPVFAFRGDVGVAEASRGYLSYYFGQLAELQTTLGQRALSAMVVFGPALLVAWRGWRWLLPGMPIALAALISTGPGGAYDYRYHHYALVVPFVLMAAIDGVRRMRATPRRTRRTWRGDLGLALAIVLIFNIGLVDTPLNPLFWAGLPARGLDPSAYGITARDTIKSRFLREEVPPRAPLAASTFLASHLVNRSTIYLVRYPDEPSAGRLPGLLPQVEVVLADALFDFYTPVDGGYGGGVTHDRDAIGLLLRDPSFGLTATRDGLLLFRRGAPPEQTLAQQAEVVPGGEAYEQRFGDAIELLEHRIEPINGRRVRASFTWRALRPLRRAPLVAVSALEGAQGARIVHLPSYAIVPTEQWQPGQAIRETFEVALPPDLPAGRYVWRVGWYNAALPFSYATDARSRLPGSQEFVAGAIEIP